MSPGVKGVKGSGPADDAVPTLRPSLEDRHAVAIANPDPDPDPDPNPTLTLTLALRRNLVSYWLYSSTLLTTYFAGTTTHYFTSQARLHGGNPSRRHHDRVACAGPLCDAAVRHGRRVVLVVPQLAA